MKRFGLIAIGVLVIIGGIALYSSTFTVHERDQALVLQFGNPIRVVQEPGLHFKLPIQDVLYFDKRIQSLDPERQEVLLADQKRVIVDSFARFRIVDPLEFRMKAGTTANFLNVFGGRLNSAVRSEVAKASLADMLSERRSSVMDMISTIMKEQAADFGVEVVDVRIVRTDLPDGATQAVFNRMRSERVAEAAQLRAEGGELKARIQAEADRERTIIIAEANRQAQILRGEGDGQRTKILNDAYGQDPEFFDFYRSLEAYSALKGDGTTLVLSPDAEFFRFFFDERGRTPGRD
jgi:modulator of FtsH protease HflC